MLPVFQRFLSLVLGPKGKTEWEKDYWARIEADLMSRLQNAPAMDGDVSVEEAVTRMEEAAHRPRVAALLRRFTLLLLPLSVLLTAAWVELPNRFVNRGVPDWLPESFRSRVAERQKSLALRPLPYSPPEYAFDYPTAVPVEPLPAFDPANPEALQQWIGNQFYNPLERDHDRLVDAWEKADPTNAWFLLYRADWLASKTGLYRISNSKAANEALDLARKAAELPKFVDYSGAAANHQHAALRRPETMKEAEAVDALMPIRPRTNGWLESLFNALMRDALSKGDSASAEELVRLTKKLSLLVLTQPGASDDEFTFQNLYLSSSLVDRLKKAGPSEALTIASDFQKNFRLASRETAIISNSLHPGQFEEISAGLKAGRYPAAPPSMLAPFQAERATEERGWAFCSAAICWLLAVIAGGLLRFVPRWNGWFSVSKKLTAIYLRGAVPRVLLFGLVLPLASWWGIVWETRLGCQDLPMHMTRLPEIGEFPWLGQMTSGPILVLAASLQWIAWERSRHFAFLGLRPRFLHWGWITVSAAALAPALYGLVRFFPDDEGMMLCTTIAASLHGIVILWLLWRIFFSQPNWLSACLSCYLAIPVFACASLISALAIFATQARERDAIRKNPVVLGPEQFPNLNTTGTIFVREMRKQFAPELE